MSRVVWGEVMRRVPRSLFAPRVAWADYGPGPWVRVDREEDAAAWEAALKADVPVVTQFADGLADSGLPTSSLSQPSVVESFLNLLDAGPYGKVLELGTAQGWTAALLAEGGLDVTTMEIDPMMQSRATENLKRQGYPAVKVILGDGEYGHAEGSPYDCVHVTASASRVPYSLIEQTRPGGVIVLPLRLGFGFGAMTKLVVMPDGTAVGTMHGSADYMMLRGQRPAEARAMAWVKGKGTPKHTEISETSVDPRRLRFCPVGADVAIAAMVPGVVSRWFEDDRPTGEGTFWILDSRGPGRSWASVDYVPGERTYRVEQAGDRRLWDETEAAYFRWISWGGPHISRFGLTVTPEGQQVWLDDPMSPLSRYAGG